MLSTKLWASKSWRSRSKQREVWESTYREDGNKNANTTKHGITNGVSLFSGVADGLVRTVKPALVRLYGASLNDQERQASYKRHKERGQKEGEKKESIKAPGQWHRHKQERTGAAQGACWHQGNMGYQKWVGLNDVMYGCSKRGDGFPKLDMSMTQNIIWLFQTLTMQISCHSFTATFMNLEPSLFLSSVFSSQLNALCLGGLTDTAGSVKPTEMSTEERTVLLL